MEKIIELFRNSAKESRKLKSIILTALFVAIALAVDGLRLEITRDLWVSFDFLAIAMVGMMFGPVAGMSAGFLTDIISVIINSSGAYFPGFTITSILGGLIYGLCLYKNNASLPRIIIARVSVNLLLNAGLNTLNLFVLYGVSQIALFPVRLTKNLILLPVEILMLVIISKVVIRAEKLSNI